MGPFSFVVTYFLANRWRGGVIKDLTVAAGAASTGGRGLNVLEVEVTVTTEPT